MVYMSSGGGLKNLRTTVQGGGDDVARKMRIDHDIAEKRKEEAKRAGALLTDKNRQLDSSKREAAGKATEIHRLEGEITRIQNANRLLKNEVDKIAMDHASFLEKIHVTDSQIAELNAKLASLANQSKRLHMEADKLASQKSYKEKELHEREGDLQELKAKEERQKHEVSRLNTTAAQLQKEAQTLSITAHKK